MTNFVQETRTSKRSLEIKRLLEDNREEILADLASLELPIRELAKKWGVQDRNIRRFAEREGIDLHDRQMRRRTSGFESRGRPMKFKPKREDSVRNPKLLSMRW